MTYTGKKNVYCQEFLVVNGVVRGWIQDVIVGLILSGLMFCLSYFLWDMLTVGSLCTLLGRGWGALVYILLFFILLAKVCMGVSRIRFGILFSCSLIVFGTFDLAFVLFGPGVVSDGEIAASMGWIYWLGLGLGLLPVWWRRRYALSVTPVRLGVHLGLAAAGLVLVRLFFWYLPCVPGFAMKMNYYFLFLVFPLVITVGFAMVRAAGRKQNCDSSME